MSAHLSRTGLEVLELGTRSELRLRPLAWVDEREAAAMLVRAFANDPLVRAICGPPERRRQEKMFWSFRLCLRAHCLSPHPGWVIPSADGSIVGLVLISFPGAALNARPDTWFSLRTLWHIGWASAQRGAEAARTVARYLPLHPFMYVRTLGVDPAFQRRGLGSFLLEHGLHAVPEALPAYLETAREENVRFYAHHGFRCLGAFRCLDVLVWRLWRPAETARAAAVARGGSLG